MWSLWTLSPNKQTVSNQSPGKQCKQGGGVWLDCLAAEVFSRLVFLYTVFMTLFPTTVEKESCELHKLVRTAEPPTTLTSTVLVVAVFPVFAGRNFFKCCFSASEPIMTIRGGETRKAPRLSYISASEPIMTIRGGETRKAPRLSCSS